MNEYFNYRRWEGNICWRIDYMHTAEVSYVHLVNLLFPPRVMASSVKSIKVTYNSINEKNSFTHGDWIAGQVTVDVAKDCQIDSLFVKIKAKADVFWTERLFNRTHVYTAKEKYLSFKYYFIRDKNLKGECVNFHTGCWSCVLRLNSCRFKWN